MMQEAGEEIMGMSASDLKALEDDAKAYDAALQHANLRPLTFNLKVAEDTYNDETQIKKSVNRQEISLLRLPAGNIVLSATQCCFLLDVAVSCRCDAS